jgi:hypothetical protein
MKRLDKATLLRNLVERQRAIIDRQEDPRNPNHGLLEMFDIDRDIKNAAPWLIAVARCFEEGDVRCIKAIIGLLQAVTGAETYSDEMDCLRRLLEAAKIMEKGNEELKR